MRKLHERLAVAETDSADSNEGIHNLHVDWDLPIKENHAIISLILEEIYEKFDKLRKHVDGMEGGWTSALDVCTGSFATQAKRHLKEHAKSQMSEEELASVERREGKKKAEGRRIKRKIVKKRNLENVGGAALTPIDLNFGYAQKHLPENAMNIELHPGENLFSNQGEVHFTTKDSGFLTGWGFCEETLESARRASGLPLAADRQSSPSRISRQIIRGWTLERAVCAHRLPQASLGWAGIGTDPACLLPQPSCLFLLVKSERDQKLLKIVTDNINLVLDCVHGGEASELGSRLKDFE